MQAADRSVRSVFVGNIPYDATEEKLRDIFSQVGPVLSFRIVFDRETGKPKGYGFCEYKDQETATSAIRNLNKYDLGGRQLRVDSASNERARDEPEEAQHNIAQHQPPPLTEPSDADAQTKINSVMRGLPPEQLFIICKQLKTSLLTNPNETKHMLLQNPQLSFAILQAMVMIEAINLDTAMKTLHQPLMQPAQFQPAMPMVVVPPQVINPYAFVPQGPPPPQEPVVSAAPPPPPMGPPIGAAAAGVTTNPRMVAGDPRLARQQMQQQQQQQAYIPERS